jgi:phosphoserine aminotransferase
VCLKIVDPDVLALPADKQGALAKAIVSRLEKEKAAFDVGAYRDAPAGLRIWCGATVEKADLEALVPWLEWAFHDAKSEFIAS